MACMSATSSRTRATAAGQTASMRAMARPGVFAIESSTRQWAWLGYPSRRARSYRSCRISVMMALLSWASPWSARETKARQTFSRRSRRLE